MEYKKITKDTLKEWGDFIDIDMVFDKLFPNGETLKTASKKLIEKGYIDYSKWLWNKCSKDNNYIEQTTIKVGAWDTVTAGDWGIATAGDYGAATAGDDGTSTVGYYGTASSGECGTSIAGCYGTASSGYWGKATAGDYGTATVSYAGTASSGECGTSIAGCYGTASAGYDGTILIKYRENKRDRIKIGYIGEDGLKDNTQYKLDGNNNFIGVQ